MIHFTAPRIKAWFRSNFGILSPGYKRGEPSETDMMIIGYELRFDSTTEKNSLR
jgi:hypothetical protein